MAKGSKEKKGTYYFVTLETRDRRDWFAEDGFRVLVERRWVEVMRAQKGLSAEEYAVNDNALHALVFIEARQEESEMEFLQRSTAAFMDLARSDWNGEGELWAPSHKFRLIEKESELRSLRDFIVQKMLGGEELNDLEDNLEDEEFY